MKAMARHGERQTEMLYISYSGGLGSAASVLLAYEHGLEYEAVFADTRIEDEDLYRFNSDLSWVTRKPLIYLRDGRTPWDVFIDKKYIGNTRTAHCSEKLKTDMVKSYIYEKHPGGWFAQMALGMAGSELDRIERARTKWTPIPVRSLLIEYKMNSTKQIREYVESFQLRIPRLYEYGFPHNNCGGFCVRGGLKQFATLLEHFPERYEKHEKEMQRAMTEIGPTARPFLRLTIKGELNYITMTEFRELYQAGKIKIDPYDYGGCACFVD
jgi:hypothetical protein